MMVIDIVVSQSDCLVSNDRRSMMTSATVPVIL